MKGVIKMVVEYDMADALKTFLRMRPDYFEITVAPKRDGSDINPDPVTVILEHDEAVELFVTLMNHKIEKERGKQNV